jgi:hypothetical protein
MSNSVGVIRPLPSRLYMRTSAPQRFSGPCCGFLPRRDDEVRSAILSFGRAPRERRGFFWRSVASCENLHEDPRVQRPCMKNEHCTWLGFALGGQTARVGARPGAGCECSAGCENGLLGVFIICMLLTSESFSTAGFVPGKVRQSATERACFPLFLRQARAIAPLGQSSPWIPSRSSSSATDPSVRHRS